MDLLGETKLPHTKTPERCFVKSVQSTQGGFAIGCNVESRHPENKSMQDVFQRIEGGKTFDKRTNHSMFPLSPPVESVIYVLPCESRAYSDRAVSYIWLEQLSQPRSRLKSTHELGHRQKYRCTWSRSRSPAGMRKLPKGKK